MGAKFAPMLRHNGIILTLAAHFPAILLHPLSLSKEKVIPSTNNRRPKALSHDGVVHIFAGITSCRVAHRFDLVAIGLQMDAR
jgi:hypothetical protein